MNWLFVSLAAQFILGTSAVADKLLLSKKFFDPLVYTFWAGVLGILVVFLIPFGFVAIPFRLVFLAILGGVLFTVATLLFFIALDRSEASVAPPMIGGLAPIFTLLISIPFLDTRLNEGDLVGFVILVGGGITLLFAERRGGRFVTFIYAILSALLFGTANVLVKLVVIESPFITGLVWLRVGGLIVLALLLNSSFRKRLTASTWESANRHKFLYLANRGYAAAGGILLVFAFSLGHPALVDATSSVKYAVIFAGAWALLHERFRGRVLLVKSLATVFIVLGVSWLAFVAYLRSTVVRDAGGQPIWGVTFSSLMSRQLGNDWMENYRAVLNDLKPAGVRLVAYWNEVEPENDKWNFSDLDWQIEEAERAGVPVILTVGQKVPRWPECHIPAWAREIKKSNLKSQNDAYASELLEYLEVIVNRYRNRSNLLYWQVENKPFLRFGECPHGAIAEFIDEEVRHVKSLDPVNPILLTDGGEFGDWYRAAKGADVFGTTIYRKVYNKIFGYLTYPLTPEYFDLKRAIVRWLTGKRDQQFIVIELGLEPWSEKQLWEITMETQLSLFSREDFRGTIEYAKTARFDAYYLWGTEWWWRMKKNGYSEYWEMAKKVMAND